MYNTFFLYKRDKLSNYLLSFFFHAHLKGESNILDVPIQAGDQDFEYLVTIRVRMFDIYGDYGIYSQNITV